MQTYNIDTSKIVAMGSSAGGHLVSLLGTRSNPPKVAAIVNFYGPVMIYGVSDVRIGNMLGCSNPEEEGTACYQAAVNASPLTHVKQANPPFLSFYGTSDDSHPAGVMFQDAGVAAEADYTFVEVPCRSHGACHDRSMMFAGTTDGTCNVDVMYTWIYQRLGVVAPACSECRPVFVGGACRQAWLHFGLLCIWWLFM